jgi:nucleoside-diphosphate-sugar epimerase
MAYKPQLLVTGSTGFIGGALAARLLHGDRWERALFLIRAPHREDGLVRLAHVLRMHGASESQLDRLHLDQILCGDLAEVSAWKNDRRLASIVDVVNSAAVASFSNHPSIWPTNVNGVIEMAHVLMRRCHLRRFLHLGTAMSCGSQAPKLVPEGYDAGTATEHFLEYTESKFEAERRLRVELPALPLIIARPSIVVGHTRLGCLPSGSIYWVFRLARALQCFPCSLDQPIDVIPVDYCAKVLQLLLEKSKLAHREYHIAAGPRRARMFGEIDVAIGRGNGLGPMRHYRERSIEEIAAMRATFERRIGPCNRRIVMRAIRAYGGFAALGMIFDNRRLIAEGAPLPPPFTSYAGLCERTSRGTLIAQQMKFDYK